MTFTLTFEDQTKTFEPLADGWVRVTHNFFQTVGVRVAECVNEWTGAMRYTGEIQQQTIASAHIAELKTELAREEWARLRKQGWA